MNLTRGLKWTTCILALAMLASPAFAGPESAGPPQATNPVAEVKSAFGQAMAKDLVERVKSLEAVDRQVDQLLSRAAPGSKDHCRAWEVKYEVQKALGKRPEAREAFGRFAGALKAWDKRDSARATLREFIQMRRVYRDWVDCEELTQAALEHWGDDPTVAPELLYYQGLGLARQIDGQRKAGAPLRKVIAEFPDSEWRPRAMRLLADLEVNGAGGGPKAAMATLELMQQQYAGTSWEQYAHMRQGMIFETRQGNPQKALARFQETLRKFPDHAYAAFCRREIARLQRRIAEQLIQDALDQVAHEDTCDHPATVIVKAGEVADQHASAAGSAR